MMQIIKAVYPRTVFNSISLAYLSLAQHSNQPTSLASHCFTHLDLRLNIIILNNVFKTRTIEEKKKPQQNKTNQNETKQSKRKYNSLHAVFTSTVSVFVAESLRHILSREGKEVYLVAMYLAFTRPALIPSATDWSPKLLYKNIISPKCGKRTRSLNRTNLQSNQLLFV